MVMLKLFSKLRNELIFYLIIIALLSLISISALNNFSGTLRLVFLSTIFILALITIYFSILKNSHAALHESEVQYHSLFDESKEPLFITTTDGRFVELNAAMVQLFGYEN